MPLLPRVPVRHWVFRPESAARWRLRSRRAAQQLVGAVVEAIFAEVRPVAAEQWGDESLRGAACGAVAVFHATGAELTFDPHVHAIVLDGVYRVLADGESTFFPLLDDPGPNAMTRIARAVRGNVARVLRSVPARVEATPTEGPIAIRRRLGGPETPEPGDGTPAQAGLYASSVVPPNDDLRRIELSRYVCRPRLPTPYLSPTAAGHLRFRLARPFADGTTHLDFDPEQLVERLADLAPRARASRFGVLAPRSRDVEVGPRQRALFELGRRVPRERKATPRVEPDWQPPLCCGHAMTLRGLEPRMPRVPTLAEPEE